MYLHASIESESLNNIFGNMEKKINSIIQLIVLDI